MDACHDELVRLGVEIVDPPTTSDYGHRTVFFRDPEGNVLEIYAEIPFGEGRALPGGNFTPG